MIAELEVAIDEADLPAEFTMEGDRGIDGDRRRAHAALGPIEGQDPAQRWTSQQDVLRREPGEQALDPGEQLCRVERLDEVVVGAGPQAAHLLLDLALGRQHDDRDVAGGPLLRPDLRGDLVAVELREHDVQEDQVGCLGAPQAESFRAIRGDEDVVALLLERVLQESLDVRVIVDDEDLAHQSSIGSAGSSGSGSPGPSASGSVSEPGAPIIGSAVRILASVSRRSDETPPRRPPDHEAVGAADSAASAGSK